MLTRHAFSVMLLLLTGCCTVLAPPKPQRPRPSHYPPPPYELVHSIPVGSTDILLKTERTDLYEIRDLLVSYRLNVYRSLVIVGVGVGFRCEELRHLTDGVP